MKHSDLVQIQLIIQSFEKNMLWTKENCQRVIDFYIELLITIENQIKLLKQSINENENNIINNNNDLFLQKIDLFVKIKNSIIDTFLKFTGKKPQEIRAFMVANNYNKDKLAKDIVGICATLKNSRIYD